MANSVLSNHYLPFRAPMMVLFLSEEAGGLLVSFEFLERFGTGGGWFSLFDVGGEPLIIGSSIGSSSSPIALQPFDRS